MPATAADEYFAEDCIDHPIDRIERLASRNTWVFERRSEAEAAVRIPGQWGAWCLYLVLARELDVLHLSCTFDITIPDSARGRVLELLVLLNERCWIGHFTVWLDEGIPMFRHTLLAPELTVGDNTVEDMIDIAVAECERVFPAFHFVLEDGMDARSAVDACLFEVAGAA